MTKEILEQLADGIVLGDGGSIVTFYINQPFNLFVTGRNRHGCTGI